MMSPVATLTPGRYRVERSISDPGEWVVLDPTGDVVWSCSTWADALAYAELLARVAA